MYIKSEKYIDDNGLHHEIKYYGKDADHISGEVDSPVIEIGEYTTEEAKALFDNGVIDNKTYHILIGEPLAENLPEMSETDEAILNTSANVEYLVALKELEV